MRYKIVITTTDKKNAEEIREIILLSRIYNSTEVIMMEPIKEVCDECATK